MSASRRCCHVSLALLGSGMVYLAACSNRPASGLKPTALAPHRNIPPALVADGAPMIRVMLDSGAALLTVGVDGPYEVRQGNRTLNRGRRLAKTTIRAVRGRGSQLIFGDQPLPGEELLILPQRAGTLWVYTVEEGRSDQRRYDGYAAVSTSPSSPGRIDLINVVSLEKYLPGVLQGELYPKFQDEAYRAQAIAARTYALYEMNTVGKGRRYDVKATEASQVYRGIDGVKRGSKAQRATDGTRGVVCTWKSPQGLKIFPTYYSSACGGITEDVTTALPFASIPPLAGGVRCNYCNIGKHAYRWGPVILSKSKVSDKLVARFPRYRDLGRISTIEVAERTRNNRPLKLGLTGEGGRRSTIDAYDFRLAMGGHDIRSTDCRIVDRGTFFEFSNGRGFGHFVGMCQWGAEGQARKGRKAGDILKFYYPGCKFTRAY